MMEDVIDGTENGTYAIYEPHYQQMHPLVYYEANQANNNDHLHNHHHPWEESLLTFPLTIANTIGTCEHQIQTQEPQQSQQSQQDQQHQQDQQRQQHQQHLQHHQHHQQVIKNRNLINIDNNSNNISDDSESVKLGKNSPNRELHNEIERKRRLRIKNCCEILRTLVPGLTDKTDKATVLEHTVTFVKHITNCPDFKCRCN